VRKEKIISRVMACKSLR